MRVSGRGAGAAVAIVIATLLLALWSPWASNGPGVLPPPANAALGDLGPGVCWPKDERPSGIKNPKAGFAEQNGPTKAAAWFTDPPKDRAEEAEHQLSNYYTWLNTHKDYYLVTKVVPNWDKLNRHERVIAYIKGMEAHQLKQPLTITNTYCDKKQSGKVVVWGKQTLPVDEWLGFVPGHGPNSKDVRPVIKLVCGNFIFLGEVIIPPQPSSTTVRPSHPTCKKGCTTTPPSTGKKPNEDPGPNGNAPEGSGRNEDPGPGEEKSYNTPPAEPYKPPAPPPADKPPAGSKPTQHNPPPPEPIKPTNGAPNTGMPPPPDW